MKRSKRAKKGIPSLTKQIQRHKALLEKAIARKDAGSIAYFKKELRALSKERSKRLTLIKPRKERLKSAKRKK